MAATENVYSQFVSLMKVVLPIAALGLMSTVFLFARAPTQDGTIPYAEIEEIAREQRISGPQVSGVADDGSIIEITARTARPNGSVLSVESMVATINALDGTQIDISAGMGEVDTRNKTAQLTGLARLVTSNGYEMETMGLSADLETGRIVSDGSLEVRTPFGELTAGQLVVETPDAEQGQRMLFQNGVRLVYTPQQ